MTIRHARGPAALAVMLAAGLAAGCRSAANHAPAGPPAAQSPADPSFGSELRVAKRPTSDTPKHLRRGGGTNC